MAEKLFPKLGFVGVRGWVDKRIIGPLNAAADRPGSKARMTAEIISGGTVQLKMDNFTRDEINHVNALCSCLLASAPVTKAAAALWGASGQDLRIKSRLILEVPLLLSSAL